MPVIDADTHVDESESTWAALEGTSYDKYIPVTVTISPEEAAHQIFLHLEKEGYIGAPGP